MTAYKSGPALARWREGRGMTQTGLARTLGLSQSYLCDMERGRKPLTPVVIDTLELHRMLPRSLAAELTRLAASDRGLRVS